MITDIFTRFPNIQLINISLIISLSIDQYNLHFSDYYDRKA